MNEWPAGWYRDEKSQPAGAGGAAEPTVRLPAGGGPAGARGPGGWPSQPPARSTAPPPYGGGPVYAPAPPRGAGRPPRGGRRRGPRRFFGILTVVIAAVLIIAVGMYFYLDGQLVRKNVLVNYRRSMQLRPRLPPACSARNLSARYSTE